MIIFILRYPINIGNHVRKLVTTPALLRMIVGLFENHPARPEVLHYVRLLFALGDIQQSARAEILNQAKRELLAARIRNFQMILSEVNGFTIILIKRPLLQRPNPPRGHTLKTHLLLFHLNAFARRHGLWGLASEQSGEHLYRLMNKNFQRFAYIQRQEEEFLWQVSRAQNTRTYFFDKRKLNIVHNY